MQLIKFEHVSLRFKRKGKTPIEALKDVSFDLNEGETLGIIGRNGAGKSTVLRIIAGTYLADNGTIIRNTDSVALLTLQLGFVPYLNGIDNAILSGMLQGLDKKTIQAKIPHITAYTELGKTMYEPINTWSTGMVQRLGFALALEIKPKILLIDESLSVGDAAFKQKSEYAIKQRIKSNQTVVLVSHSISTIEELCDRVVWIENGETQMQGGTSEVLAKYQHYVKQSMQKHIWQ